jgi:branched-chain amino acid transport system ATP-binding protein
MKLLKTENLTKDFAGFRAVNEVNFELEEGMLVSIIGPNGAGKTTFFNLITGLHPPTKGRVFFKGKDITQLEPYERLMRGLSRTFQIVNIFPGLSVFDNMLIAMLRRNIKWSNLRASFLSGSSKGHSKAEEGAYAIMEEVGLIDQKDGLAGSLPHGYKKRLEVSMAIASEPKLLLLDEPFGGLSPVEIKEMMAFTRKISNRLTIVLVEHKLDTVMDLSQRISVLHEGGIIAEGKPKEIRENEFVQEVYLKGRGNK